VDGEEDEDGYDNTVIDNTEKKAIAMPNSKTVPMISDAAFSFILLIFIISYSPLFLSK
jgi:hypothetical protein